MDFTTCDKGRLIVIRIYYGIQPYVHTCAEICDKMHYVDK